jgi:probable phosphoglycerate mutase
MRSRPETRFILIRHGQSDFNLQRRIQGCSDEPRLTDRGRSTADQAAEYLLRAGVTRIISSPLRRAFEFATRIRFGLGANLDLRPEARLREVDLPRWEGLEISSVERNQPEVYRAWRERPDCFEMAPGLKPVPELYARAASFWREMSGQFAGETVLLVTHSGTIRALVSTALGIPPTRFHSIQQSNGGLTILDSSPAGFTLVCLNSTGYLGEGLPKLKDGKTGVRLALLASGAFEEFRLRLQNAIRANGVQTHVRLLDAPELKRHVAQALGSSSAERQLRMVPLGLSVMHYVAQNRLPVVQTIELPQSQVWGRNETC